MGTRLWQLLFCVWKDGIIDCYGYGVGAHEGLSKQACACLHTCVSVCLCLSVTIQLGQDQLVVPRGKGVGRADLATVQPAFSSCLHQPGAWPRLEVHGVFVRMLGGSQEC